MATKQSSEGDSRETGIAAKGTRGEGTSIGRENGVALLGSAREAAIPNRMTNSLKLGDALRSSQASWFSLLAAPYSTALRRGNSHIVSTFVRAFQSDGARLRMAWCSPRPS